MGIYMDIHKTFKDFSLNVKVENHEGTLGILGASGCGKSLTLKCLAGIETPDEGVIRVGGKTVFDSAAKIDLKPRQRNVGYLFQSYALFPNMTVHENINIAFKKGTSGREDKIKKLISDYQLEGLEDRYPVNLSGGQQQRTALARIFAYEPEILLLDEPFSALDSYLRGKMQAMLLDVIKSYDGDVVMVTHNRDEAYRICDRLMIFDSGKVIGDDKPHNLFHSPGNVDVAKMTGCKNISRIEKLGTNRVLAVDWGFELDVDGLDDTHTHIGIRAHYFTQDSGGGESCGTGSSPSRNSAGSNRIDTEVLSEMVGPFEKTVIFKNPKFDNCEELWWICPKGQDTSGLQNLYVRKGDIYLLSD